MTGASAEENTTMKNQKRVNIEPLAFAAGTEGANPDHPLAEIEAQFAALQQRVHREADRPSKLLESLGATLKSRKTEAEQVWLKLKDRTAGVPPQITLPLLAV